MSLFDIFKGNNSSQNSVSSVTAPIEGYTMINYYKNVEVRRLGSIPDGAKVGSKLALLYEPATKDQYETITLLLVPQKKVYGYIKMGEVQKMIVPHIKKHEKIVARITSINYKPYQYDSTIDIAVFKKNKAKSK